MISLPNGMDAAFHKSRSIRLTTNVLRQLSSQDRRACGLVSITISQARRGLIISPSLMLVLVPRPACILPLLGLRDLGR